MATAQADHAVRTAYAIGGWRLTAEAGSGRRLSPDHAQWQPGSNYFRTGLERTFGAFTTSFGVGELAEPQGPLGSYLPQSSGFGLPSKTGFVSWGTRWGVMQGVNFNTEASFGRTDLRGGLLQTAGPALSSSWRMSLDANCAVLGVPCTSAHLSLSQPLRIERGDFTVVLPDVPQEADDPLTFSTRRFAASPSGREVDLRLMAERDMGRYGEVSVQAVVSREPGNIEGAPAAAGGEVGWRLTF